MVYSKLLLILTVLAAPPLYASVTVQLNVTDVHHQCGPDPYFYSHSTRFKSEPQPGFPISSPYVLTSKVIHGDAGLLLERIHFPGRQAITKVYTTSALLLGLRKPQIAPRLTSQFMSIPA